MAIEPLGNSDHNTVIFQMKINADKKCKNVARRIFYKGNYRKMRDQLSQTDWYGIMQNKMLSRAGIFSKTNLTVW